MPLYHCSHCWGDGRSRRNEHLSLPSSRSGSGATYWHKEACWYMKQVSKAWSREGGEIQTNDGHRQLMEQDLATLCLPFIPSNWGEHLHLAKLSTDPGKIPSSPAKVARIIHLRGLPWTYFFHLFHEISGEHSCWLSQVGPQWGKRATVGSSPPTVPQSNLRHWPHQPHFPHPHSRLMIRKFSLILCLHFPLLSFHPLDLQHPMVLIKLELTILDKLSHACIYGHQLD